MEKKLNERPLILSIESSGINCSVCIAEGDKIIAEYSINKNNSHDRLLAVLINRILNDIGIKFQDLDAVAVSSGPGSFTGLRIGAAIAKSLCYGNTPKLIAVPTFSALAAYSICYVLKDNIDKILVMAQSHKGLVYSQIFSNNAEPLNEISIGTDESFLRFVEDKTLIVSNKEHHIFGKHNLDLSNLLKASTISFLALKMYDNFEFCNAESYIPVYIQEFIPKYNDIRK